MKEMRRTSKKKERTERKVAEEDQNRNKKGVKRTGLTCHKRKRENVPCRLAS
jgi:hypothetical protein